MNIYVKVIGGLLAFSMLTACVGGGAMDINTPHTISVSTKTVSKPLRVQVAVNDAVRNDVSLGPDPRGHDVALIAPPIGSVVRVSGSYEGQAEPLRLEFISRGNRAPRSYTVLFEEQNGLMTLSCKAPDLGPCY